VNDVAARLADARARIAAACARAGRDAGDVAVVAVTKGFPVTAVVAALDAGADAIGESRAQDLLDKAAALEALDAGRAEAWHFVGRVQRNKIARVAPVVSVWHAIDRLEVVDALAARRPDAGVYIQVNVSGEAQKGGCDPTGAAALADAARAAGLSLMGLMAVPARGGDPRPAFARLRTLAEQAGVEGLSMGMSDDFEAAVEEGATVVRLGRALFGDRAPEGAAG
jgi:pyridoxal phosphate enzyme (YggS family)